MLTRLAGFWFEQQTLQAVFYPNKLGLLADLILQVSKTSTYGDASRTLGCTFPRGAIRTASSGEIGCKDPPRTMQKAACKARKFAENFGSESLLPCVCRSFPRGRSGKHFSLERSLFVLQWQPSSLANKDWSHRRVDSLEGVRTQHFFWGLGGVACLQRGAHS